MAAWSEMADDAYDAAESLGQSEGFDPYEWTQDECSVDELCAAIDDASNVFALLADETAELSALVARRVA